MDPAQLTLAGVRRLLNKVLPTDSDLHAFLLDAFADSSPELYQRVSGLHDRKDKVTLLLTLKSDELDELLGALERHYPVATQRYRYLLDGAAASPAVVSSGSAARSGSVTGVAEALLAPPPTQLEPVIGVRRLYLALWGTVAVALLLGSGGWFWRERQSQSQLDLEHALEAVSQAERDVQQRRWSQVIESSQALLARAELPVALRKRAQAMEHAAHSEQAEQLQLAQYQARITQPDAEDATLLSYRQVGASSVYFPDAEALFREHAERRSSRYLEQAEAARQRGQCAESQGFLARVRVLLPQSPQLRDIAARPCAVAPAQPEGAAAATPTGLVAPTGPSVESKRAAVRQRSSAAKPSAAVDAQDAENTLDFEPASDLLQQARQASSPSQGLLCALKATRARKPDLENEAWEYVFRFACQLRERALLAKSLPRIPRHRLPELLHVTDCLDQVGTPKTYILRSELR